MWNIAYIFKKDPSVISVVRGYDERPLRYTDKAFAERQAHEWNSELDEFNNFEDFHYVVIEETNH